MNKRLVILHTGGTLGMDSQGNPFSGDSFMNVLRHSMPRVFEVADIRIEILLSKDSSNIGPKDWVMLARRLHDLRDEADAFVIIHGTDTMAFTASALSFMFANFGKPIILTGSQRPLSDPRTDAARNLLNAIQIALDGYVKEVCLFFDSTLIRGNRAKKISIPSFKAFESPNHPILATVGTETQYLQKTTEPPGPYVFDPRIETRIMSISIFPGIDVEPLFGLLDRGIKGFVLQAFGPGDVPVSEPPIPTLIRAMTERGIPAVICSHAIFGSVDLGLYETGRAARTAGAISTIDMTWEAAMVKMMILLGRGLSLGPFKNQFQTNLAGELTDPRLAS